MLRIRQLWLPGAALLIAALVALAIFAISGSQPAPARAAATPVTVYPTPGSDYELPATQISFRGISAADIGTVTVTGSASGVHTGTLVADSDGDGASFKPTTAFTGGETVTVQTGLDINGGNNGSFSFTINQPGPANFIGPVKAAAGGAAVMQSFKSAPTLHPLKVDVAKDDAPANQGDWFVATERGPLTNGPEIFAPDGRLVWYLPYSLGLKETVEDFKVEQLYGKKVLTYTLGTHGNGVGNGVGEIFNDRYQNIATVHAADGLDLDTHEFSVTNNGDAWLNATTLMYYPGVLRPTLDDFIQEIDIKTGNVLFEWNALDHFPHPGNYSYKWGPHQMSHVEDPFHMNAVQPLSNGNILVSMRNLDAMFEISQATGQIQWILGGKHSSFTMGPGTRTAFQHDARMQSDGDITVFDNGAGPPKVHDQSRGLEIKLNLKTMTATEVRQVEHTPGPIASYYEGSVQTLSQGDLAVGWGQRQWVSEYNGENQQIYDAEFATTGGSYRAYRFKWFGQPAAKPALAWRTIDGHIDLYASWNGATDVASWRVLAGPTASSLQSIGTYVDDAFETTMIPPLTGTPQVEVQALGAHGKVLGTSAPQQVG